MPPANYPQDPFNPPSQGQSQNQQYASSGPGLPHPQSQATGPGPYYDAEPDMQERYEGGGMGRETWASESGWSDNYCEWIVVSLPLSDTGVAVLMGCEP